MSNSNATQYHHGNLRSALIVAARELLDEERPATLRAVARRVGVSQAAPYRHFIDKEEMLAAVVEQGFLALGAAMATQDDVIPIEARICALGVVYVRFAVEHRGWFRLMFGDAVEPSKYPDCDVASKAAFNVLAQAIGEAVRIGRIVGESHTITLLAWSLVHGLSCLMLGGQGIKAGLDPSQADVITEQIVHTAFAGLLISS